jgi:hypothetical protein
MATRHKKASTKMADQEIPELKREQLGKGVRGKYLKNFTQGSNVVVLQPEILKAFPISEAVNKALASMLAFAKEHPSWRCHVPMARNTKVPTCRVPTVHKPA